MIALRKRAEGVLAMDEVGVHKTSFCIPGMNAAFEATVDAAHRHMVLRTITPEFVRIQLTNGRGQDHQVELLADGSTRLCVIGKNPRGEEGTDDAARILATHLEVTNRIWPGWTVNSSHEVEADQIILDRGFPIRLQVARVVDPKRCMTLAAHPGVWWRSTVADHADELGRAIQKKAGRYHIDVRRALVLALDAEYLVHATKSVVREFRKRHSAAAATAGFAEVWVVGPAHDFVARLDLDSDY